VVEMLRLAFEHAGIVAVSTFMHLIRSGAVNIETVVREHRPQVVVYDVAPPYANNWLLFQHTAHLPAMAGLPFVLTTTNRTHVKSLAGESAEPIFEIVGLPYDIDLLVGHVRQALELRPQH
jgi:DNA-binding NtrC family response regulator